MRGVVHVWRCASKSGDAKTYTSDALNWCFAKMTRKAGIGHWHAREGRHTAVSIMSSNGSRSRKSATQWAASSRM